MCDCIEQRLGSSIAYATMHIGAFIKAVPTLVCRVSAVCSDFSGISNQLSH